MNKVCLNNFLNYFMFYEQDQVQEFFGFRIEINEPDCVHIFAYYTSFSKQLNDITFQFIIFLQDEFIFDTFASLTDYNNMSKFLNRILGLEVTMQNFLFKYFTDTLAAVILQAKRNGRWDLGILGENLIGIHQGFSMTGNLGKVRVDILSEKSKCLNVFRNVSKCLNVFRNVKAVCLPQYFQIIYYLILL